MMLTRLAVGLEPLNALDAAHRSPRSAPRLARSEFGSPVGPATHRSIKRNKELPNLLAGTCGGQVSHSVDQRRGERKSWMGWISHALFGRISPECFCIK